MDILFAVWLKENNQRRLIDYFDEKSLPSVVRTLSVGYNDNVQAAYCLWRIKKYSKEFSVVFPEEVRSILDKVSDDRPKFPGKIGNE